MTPDLILGNVLNPPILFFFLGVGLCLLRSDLDFPQPLPKFFSLYLLFAIGYKGGLGLAESGLDMKTGATLATASFLAALVPLYAFIILRWKLDHRNAAAIAATYGSISAVTFITAGAFLDRLGVSYGGHMVAAMALMESPAIVVGVLLARRFETQPASRDDATSDVSLRRLLHEAFLNGSVALLLGALAIGWVCGERGFAAMKPFTHDLFYGMLALFLLDMGIVSARRIGSVLQAGPFLLGFAILFPLFNAVIGIGSALLLDLTLGDALLLVVLVASSSYIAVPAAMRMAVPEANPGLYVPISLAVTFPFNIILGIPLYYGILIAAGLQ